MPEQPPRAVGGGEELAVPARLAEPVGEQQQPVARLQPLDPRPDHRHEAQRRRRGRRFERDHRATAHQQRRGMPTVDDGEGATPLLHQRRGDEVLVAHTTGHCPVQVRHDGPQVGPLIGDVPVRAQHDARQPDRFQTLAAYVTDDHSYAVRGVDRLVQIAADLRCGGRGDVPPGHRQRAHLRTQRAQHRLLGDRRELRQLGDPLRLPFPYRRHRRRQTGAQRDAGHRDRGGERDGRLGEGERGPEQGRGGTDPEHDPPGRQRRGQERGGHHQRDVVRLTAVRQLDRRDDHEQDEGRAEAGAGSGAQRATARLEELRAYTRQHARWT